MPPRQNAVGEGLAGPGDFPEGVQVGEGLGALVAGGDPGAEAGLAEAEEFGGQIAYRAAGERRVQAAAGDVVEGFEVLLGGDAAQEVPHRRPGGGVVGQAGPERGDRREGRVGQAVHGPQFQRVAQADVREDLGEVVAPVLEGGPGAVLEAVDQQAAEGHRRDPLAAAVRRAPVDHRKGQGPVDEAVDGEVLPQGHRDDPGAGRIGQAPELHAAGQRAARLSRPSSGALTKSAAAGVEAAAWTRSFSARSAGEV